MRLPPRMMRTPCGLFLNSERRSMRYGPMVATDYPFHQDVAAD